MPGQYRAPPGNPGTWQPDEVVINKLVRALRSAADSLPNVAGMRYGYDAPHDRVISNARATETYRVTVLDLIVPAGAGRPMRELEVHIRQRDVPSDSALSASVEDSFARMQPLATD